jgi:hypothetical protein
MTESKSIPRLPDFGIEDIHRKFACWLQARCREDRFFFRKILDVTWASEDTVKRWRKGYAPGAEAMLRALGYAGPQAVDEVLLEPMGMAGARWIEDDRISGPIHAARRAIRAARDQIASGEPGIAEDVDFATDATIALAGEVNSLLKDLTEIRRQSGNANARIVDLPAQRERQA